MTEGLKWWKRDSNLLHPLMKGTREKNVQSKHFLMAIKREYSEVNSGDYTFGPRLAFKRWGYDGVWTLPVTYSYRVNGAHTNNYVFSHFSLRQLKITFQRSSFHQRTDGYDLQVLRFDGSMPPSPLLMICAFKHNGSHDNTNDGSE